MTRAEGSPNVFVNDIAWSRQGDNNTSHLLSGITTGSTSVFVNGKGAGRVGDSITGCTTTNVFCGP